MNDDPEPSDEALLHAFVAGDDDAFAVLFRRHRRRLWKIGLRMLGPDEAEDGLSAAVERAIGSATGFRGEAAVGTWLTTIMLNVCRTRRAARRPTVSLDDDGVREQAVARDARDPYRAVDDRLLVRSVLEDLSEEQRLAVVLVDMYHYSVEDAAAWLGVPRGTVQSRCWRARVHLARMLRERYDRELARGAATGGLREDDDGREP